MVDHQQSAHEDYLLLDWERNGHLAESAILTPTPAPITRISKASKSSPINNSDEKSQSENREPDLRARQPKPGNPLSTSSLHDKSYFRPRPSKPQLTKSDSSALSQFYDLRAIHNLSPNEDLDLPQEILELHVKRSKEKNGVNPNELPEIWKAPPPPTEPPEDIEMVQRAPIDDDEEDDDISNSCRSIQGKYGERASKNAGVIFRYQYELIQDLDNSEWVMNGEEKDGSEYLVENVVPLLEQRIGDILVSTLFEDCNGDSSRVRGLRRLRSAVAGLDGDPCDFPLGQGECISEYTPENSLLNYQCHIMEGAVTLFFPPNYSYATVLTAAHLQVLRAIKDDIESGELQKSSDKILSLLFLDNSYSLTPIYQGEVDKDWSTVVDPPTVDSDKSNIGLIVGIVILILVILGLTAGGLYYKRKRDKELAVMRQQREAEEQNAKAVRASAYSSSSRRRTGVECDDGSTTSGDGDGSTTSGDGSTTSGDDDHTTSGYGTTTSDDEDSTTSGSKETTTDSSDSESDSASDGPYGNMYGKKKQRAKRIKNNLIYSGGDEASVMTGATGATGFHSMSSQRTVKMKNVVMPNVLGVDINMK